MNRKFVGILFTLAMIFTSNSLLNTSAFAQNSLLVEDFQYAQGALLTDNGWSAHSGAGTNALTVVSPGLTLTGYPSSGVGNAVSMTTSGEDVNRAFTVQTSGSVYAAFMVNVSEAAVDPIGGYFFHLSPDPIGTNFRGRVFIKKDASNNIAFGISKAGTNDTSVGFTPFSYALNTTYLVVVKYTIIDGATNDTISLFVSTTTPATEPAPTASALDVNATDINPGTVALRQGTATTSPTVTVDGIRIGTTWASVTQVLAPTDANVDFNGDGKSDFVVTRIGSGQLTWFVNTGTGTTSGTDWGIDTDFRTPEDFDGDGKDDIAVWRGGNAAQAAFYILQSSNNTLRIEIFGQTGDDARVVADYDGDGKADPAVYRKASGQNFYYYRGSLNNPNGNITYVPWGSSQMVRPNVGDYDGDGKADFCIFTQDPRFILLRSSDSGVEYINWGIVSDALVPGDFDGDGKDDFCVVRNNAGALNWYILERDGGGTGGSPISWGLLSDFYAPGDYDGDGKQDVAIWRPSEGNFYIRRSSNSSLQTFTWGASGDNSDANWYVHIGGTP